MRTKGLFNKMGGVAMGRFAKWLFVLSLMTAALGETSDRWLFVGGTWRMDNGQLIGESSDGHAFALATFRRYAQAQTVEVKVTPLKRRGGGWSGGGLCVFQDGGNFWRLALVEAPDGQTRYAELVAMSGGAWQAQSEKRLKVVADFNPNFAWRWGTPYRLRITVSSSLITGEVFGTDGRLLWRRSFALDNVPIVRSGWLALNVQGMQAAFADATQQTAESEAVAMRDVHQAVIVRDAAMGNAKLAGWLATELRKLGVQVDGATLDDLTSPQWWQRMKAGILVLPNGRRLPADAKEPLLDFLRQGGKLVAFGAPLFGEPLFKTGRGWMSSAEIEATRKQTKPQRWLFERLDENEPIRWRHHASHPDVTDRLTFEPATKLRFTHHALRMDFTLKGWAIFSREFAESPFPKGHTLTCFWAKGTPQTKALMVEWRELDGTRWYAHLPLTKEWKLIVLSPRDFAFRGDSPTRGKRGFAGDRLNLQEARALVLGMEAPMPPGEHTIWVAGIGTAPDPFGDVATDFEPPILETLSPAYKLFPLRNVKELRDWGSGTDELAAKGMPADAVAPAPRWRGLGFTGGERVARWQPLLMAHDRTSERGALVWQMRYGSLPFTHATWLVFGSSDESFWLKHANLLRSALRRALTSWSQRVWSLEGGADRFTAYQDEPMTMGAVVVNSGAQSQTVTVRLRVEGKTGVVHERQETTSVDAFTTKPIRFPVEPLPAGDYRVTVQLALAGQVVDEIAHELVVIPRPKITDADKVIVKDGHFVVSKERRWFAFGVNFWPRYVAGKEPSDYYRHWLDPTNYDPELVEQDLGILRDMGMNCVSVQYTSVRQALPLRDFLRRCHEHGIKVNLFIAGAHPLNFQPDLVRQLIEAADLPHQPALFAYDIAWEPHWGNYDER